MKLAAAALAAATLSLVSGQMLDVTYLCPEEDIDGCDAAFQVCSQFKVQQENPEMLCKCWTDAFVCYRDCGDAFPSLWSQRCLTMCDATACSPS